MDNFGYQCFDFKMAYFFVPKYLLINKESCTCHDRFFATVVVFLWNHDLFLKPSSLFEISKPILILMEIIFALTCTTEI